MCFCCYCDCLDDCLTSIKNFCETSIFVRLGCSCSANHAPVAKVNKDNRACTDLPFLAIYIASWILMAVVFSIAISNGAQPERLVYGVDYADRICGISAGVEDKPLAAWPKIYPPYEDLSPLQLFDIKVCISDCNETMTSLQFVDHYVSQQTAYYCIPDFSLNSTALETFSSFDRFGEILGRTIGDLQTAYDVMIYMCLLAMFFTWVYCWLANRFAGFLVYSTLGMVVAGGAILAYYLYEASSAQDFAAVGTEQSKSLQIASIVVIVLTIVFLLVIIALRERIYIAVEIIRETSKAIWDVPSVLLLPFVTVGLSILYFVWWIYVALYLYSVTVFKPDEPLTSDLQGTLGVSVYKDRQWDDSLRNLGLFHFFHLLWNMQFILYFLYYVLCSVLADWYFSRYDADGKKKIRGDEEDQFPRFALLKAIYRTLRYNLGTIAFGSFLIALIQFFRYILNYIQSKLVFENPNSASAQLAKTFLALVDCLLRVIECCVDKMNKNGFIYSAIYGEAYCASACSSFQVVWRNLARFAALNLISDFLVIVGKFGVSLACSGIAALLYRTKPKYAEMSSILFPCLCVFVISYLASSIFMMVYETCIDAVFFCFLIDEELNRNTGNMFASEGLRAIVDKHQLESERLAMRSKTSRATLDTFKTERRLTGATRRK